MGTIFYWFNGLMAAIIIAFGMSNFLRIKERVNKNFALTGLICLWVTLLVDLLVVIDWGYHKYENWHLALLAVIIFIVQGPVVWFWKQCTIEIPDDPTHCGAIQIWGKRSGNVVGAGYRFHAPFFPFNLIYIPISLVQRKDEVIMTVWCKADDKISVECRVRFSIFWKPDKSRTNEFINRNKDAGIIDRIPDIAEAQIEEFSQQEEWDEFLRDKKGVKKRLIESIANVTDSDDLSAETGAPDIHSLGITIFGILVDDIEPVNKALIEAMIQKPIEERERGSQNFQEETDRENAKTLVKESGGTLSFDKAIAMVKESRQLDEKKITKSVDTKVFEGLDNVGDGGTLLALLSSLGGGKK